jgi:hypothetical protein
LLDGGEQPRLGEGCEYHPPIDQVIAIIEGNASERTSSVRHMRVARTEA